MRWASLSLHLKWKWSELLLTLTRGWLLIDPVKGVEWNPKICGSSYILNSDHSSLANVNKWSVHSEDLRQLLIPWDNKWVTPIICKISNLQGMVHFTFPKISNQTGWQISKICQSLSSAPETRVFEQIINNPPSFKVRTPNVKTMMFCDLKRFT